MKTFLTKIHKSPNLQILKSSNLQILQALFLLVSLSLNAQLVDVCYPGKDQPVFLRFYDGKEMHRLVIPDWEVNPLVKVETQDATYNFDLDFMQNEGQSSPNDDQHDILEWIDPGVPIEGDMPCDIAYSKDGTMFAVIYQQSDNVIFYSARTYEILANVQVPRQPLDIKFGKDHAYVCCHKGQGIAVISLEDFSVSNYAPVDGTPCQVELSPTEDTAYIACDSWLDGWLVCMDLRSNEMIYSTHEPYFHHYGWGGFMGREMYSITKFNLSPKGDQFISAYTHPIWPAIFNAYTGKLIDTLRFGGYRGAKYSPTGDTLYIYSNHEDSVKMYRLNTADNTFIDSIYAFAESLYGFVDYSDLAISRDGSRVLINDATNARFCLFDFNTYSCQLIPEAMLYTDSPTYSSYDGEFGICTTLTQVKLINLESGEVYGTYSSGARTNMPLGVSPKEAAMIVANAPDYWSASNEILYAIDFENIESISLDTSFICGQAPEADVSSFAELSVDGEKIFSSNILTHNFSVINLSEHMTDTVVNINTSRMIKVVPRSDYGLVFGKGKTKIISLADYSIVKELNTGSVDEAYISSDGFTGYLLTNQGGNTDLITKIHIDGAESSILDHAMVGSSHSSIYFIVEECDMNTTTAFSPDEQYLLLGHNNPSLGPVINIVDAETLDLLASVNVPSWYIFGYAFTDDSKRVVAVGVDTQVPIIYLDRENSFLENVFSINSYSFSADYNPQDGLFYVLAQDNLIHKVDPLTGEIVESLPTYNDNNWRIAIDNRGLPMVLTSTSLIYDRDDYPMPGVSTELTYNIDYDLFISPVPGPDVICVFDPKMVGIQQFKPGIDNEVSIFPNPATDKFVVKAASEILMLKVCNIAGNEVFSGDFNDRIIEIPTGYLAPGVYLIDIQTKEGNFSRKILVR